MDITPKPASLWFPADDATTRTAAEEMLLEHKGYVEQQLKKMKSGTRQELERLVVRSRRQTKASRSKPDGASLADVLDAMSLDDLSAYVVSELTLLSTAHEGLEKERSRGFHKVTAKTQKFMTEFDRFVSAYSGIVNIVAFADAQHGGVACATLAVLFSTVKMKTQAEDAMTSAMEQISDRLPDFKMYRKIYPDPDLCLMLVKAYKDVIRFARAATSYFQGSTFTRQLSSLGKPLIFETMESDIRDNFSRIRLKCEALLAQRVDALVQQLGSVEQDFKDLLKRLDTSHILALRGALGLQEYRPEELPEHLDQYRRTLAWIFDHDPHTAKFRMADFLAHDIGRCWQDHGASLFMLFGRNEARFSFRSESWLSPVAVELAQTLLTEHRMVAFVSCNENSTVLSTLAKLIFQLLVQNPSVVRRAEDWRLIESRVSSSESERYECLLTALLKIVNLQKGPTFIIIDRPEFCEEDSVTNFAEAMLHLVELTECDLKVLVTYKAELWDFETNKAGFLRRLKKPDALRAIRLDQGLLR